jgi:ribonuclease-3
VSPLEERIGYKFRNSLLLAEALTHPSLSHETQRYHFDNQRLEFLGDAVLQACDYRISLSPFWLRSRGTTDKITFAACFPRNIEDARRRARFGDVTS